MLFAPLRTRCPAAGCARAATRRQASYSGVKRDTSAAQPGDLSHRRGPKWCPRRATAAATRAVDGRTANAQGGSFAEDDLFQAVGLAGRHKTLSSTPGRFFFMLMAAV